MIDDSLHFPRGDPDAEGGGRTDPMEVGARPPSPTGPTSAGRADGDMKGANGPQAAEFAANQRLAAAWLAHGEKMAVVARRLKVDRTTIHRWLKNPIFQAEVNRIQQ